MKYKVFYNPPDDLRQACVFVYLDTVTDCQMAGILGAIKGILSDEGGEEVGESLFEDLQPEGFDVPDGDDDNIPQVELED